MTQPQPNQYEDNKQPVTTASPSNQYEDTLKCGHNGPDWNGEGDCITCARDKVLGTKQYEDKEFSYGMDMGTSDGDYTSLAVIADYTSIQLVKQADI